MQRALLQYYEPRNRDKVRRALGLAGRRDLMGKLLGAPQHEGRGHAAPPARQKQAMGRQKTQRREEKQGRWQQGAGAARRKSR